MSKQETLRKIREIIQSGNYDVEELLSVVPDELLMEVTKLIQDQTKQESEEIQNNISSRSR